MLSRSTVPFPKPSLAQPQKKGSWLGFHRRLQRTTSAALDHIFKKSAFPAPLLLSYLQHERHEEVESSHSQQDHFEAQVTGALQTQELLHEGQRKDGQPDHEAGEQE